MRRIRVAAERRANAVEFVSSDSGAHATTADQDSDLSGAVLDSFADLFGVIRIIVRDRAIVRAEVDQIVTAMAQFFNHPFIEWIPRMICPNRNSHPENPVILFYD